MKPRKLLAWVLRIDGLVLTTAFVAVFLSTDFMDHVHARLGMGELPRSPLVEYLTRSIAVLYATRGLFVLLASTDLERYRPLILLIGWTNVLIGGFLLGIDLYAGMPSWWTAMEGPPIALVGVLILLLARWGAASS